MSIFLFLNNAAITQTVGLFQHSYGSNDDGYVLFSPISYTKTYLIDKCGKQVHSWTSTYRPGLSASIMTDGILLRTGNTNNASFNAGGRGGILQKLDWNSNVVWSYLISNTLQCQHHDARALDNGNILTIIWVKKTSAEAIAAGRNPSTIGTELWTEKLVELQPTGVNTATIVWEWNVWDNLIQQYDPSKPNYGVVADHPDLVNLNFTGTGSASDPDWLHTNSIDYNPEFNQVMISVHDFNEIWIIDRDFGVNGKLVYRWGNPAAFNRGTSANQKLFGQHNAQWIKSGFNHSGDISIFNNGVNRPQGNYSSVDLIKAPVDSNGNYFIQSGNSFGPDSAYWSFKDSVPTNFYAMNISGAMELNNGNFLICNGPSGNFFEIDSLKRKVWKYVNPVSTSGPVLQGTNPTMNSVFKCTFYNTLYSGLSGHVLTPGNPIELNPLNYSCDLLTGLNVTVTIIPEGFYNSITESLNMKDTVKAYLRNNYSPYSISDSSSALIDSLNYSGNFIFSNAGSGYYYIQVKHRNCITTWSKAGGELIELGIPGTYDFTSDQVQSYGSNSVQIDNSPLRYGIFSGDVNQDGIVDLSDEVLIFNDASNFINGYVRTDINGDKIVDLTDLTLTYNNVINFVSAVAP